MESIVIQFPHHSYPVYIGTHLLNQTDLLVRHIRGQQVAIVCDEMVATHYLPTLQHTLRTLNVTTLIIPAGESQKNIFTVDTLVESLIMSDHHRHTTLIALGGGVISDLVGFTASCYLRGVNYLIIPTTLLAQVDASIGGKTAVNHRLGKNMIGAIYQPQCVIVDSFCLTTLSDRDFYCGLAEAIKHAVIAGNSFFRWLEDSMPALLSRDLPTINKMITQSCQIKAAIIEQDEHEKNIRKLLNLGHTFAHALELMTNHQLKHGEAVSIGMTMAATLSHELGLLDKTSVERIKHLLQRAGLPLAPKQAINIIEMMQLMKADKKRLEEGLTLILLRELGDAIATTVPFDRVLDFLKNTSPP